MTESGSPKTLVFATGNSNKKEEIAALIGSDTELKDLRDLGVTEDISETGATLHENACIKAQYLWDRFGLPVFADDTGLETTALDNRPGVYSARYAGPAKDPVANMQKLLRELQGLADRSAQCRTVIAYIDSSGKLRCFEGIAKGQILQEPRGAKGFGYDPIFLPEGHERSFAQMGLKEKNGISHRARAFRSFIAFLEDQKS